MTENPERRVLDAIDELVEESLARPISDDYSLPWRERCELCGGDWHGLPDTDFGCPGAFATDEQREAFAATGWEKDPEPTSSYAPWLLLLDGPGPYTLAQIAALNGAAWAGRGPTWRELVALTSDGVVLEWPDD